MRRSIVLLVDIACVAVFAAIGRASHDENPLLGLLHTAWPFAVALLVAWAVVAWRRWDALRWAVFVLVWLVSAWGGLVLRHLVGQGTRWPFPVVATVTLGMMLALGRVVLRVLARRRPGAEAAGLGAGGADVRQA